MATCLDNIIGVTSSDCSCYGIPNDSALHTSVSGIFIDELEGGISLKAATQTDACKTLVEMMLEIRDIALKTLWNDVRLQIADKYSKAAKPYVGFIGENTFTTNLPVSNYFGQRWRSNGHVDAVTIVKKLSYIGTAPGASADDNLILYKQVGGERVLPVQVFSTKLLSTNQGNAITTELRLPMTEQGMPVTYYWQVNGTGFVPRNNLIRCNCGQKLILLDTFVVNTGFTSATPSVITQYTGDADAHGLIFEVEIRCDDSQLICREYDENNAVSVTLGYAAQYKAGELLIESVLRSPEVNRFTMMNREYLWGKRNHFKKEYEDRIKYIRKVVEVAESGCFICRSTDLMFGNLYS